MSNPGVVNLSQMWIGNQELRIEDNIGEAIHIHFGNIRIDFSILEFFELTDKLIEIMEKMINIENFSFRSYDAIWLSQISSLLIKLKKIELEKRNVGNLLTNQYDDEGQSIISIKKARVLKAIHGDISEIEQWRQTNYVFDDNICRLKNIYESIKVDGYYPEKRGTFIVVCDNGSFVADGCHRASSIYDLYGDIEITVADWITEDKICSDNKRKEWFAQEKKKIAIEHKKEINKKEFKKLQTYYLAIRDLSGKKIIIKGAGEHSKQFIELCGNKLNIIGILSKEILNDSLKFFPKIEENNLEEINAELIFISSYKYRKEMKEELKKYEDRFEIYDLYEQGIDEEFFL